jgi:L-ascorbate metabolism protein UlaG (beta-lactamase superfamily)
MRIVPLEDKKLSLVGSGALELFFFGIGSAFSRRQYQTNLLIMKGKDHLLVDCGTRLPPLLKDLGLQVTDIKNILITHSHADHIGGLEEFALSGRYIAKNKPTMVINEAYQQILWDMSLRGGCGFNEGEDVPAAKLAFSDFFDTNRPKRLPGYSRETFDARVGKIKLLMMRTKHFPDNSPDWQHSFWSCGLIIDERVMFTSDTRYDPDLINYYEKKFNLEAIFHDCQLFTGGIHAGIEEINRLPRRIKKKIHLAHYGDNWESYLGKVSEYGFASFAQQHVRYVFD